MHALQQQVTRASADLARVLVELRSLDARTAETQEHIRESSSELAGLRARFEAAEEELRQSRAAAPPPPPLTPPAALPALPNADQRPDAAADEPAEQAYAAALNTFRAREHGQAVLDFMDFVAKYPTHPLAPHAQYWIGEAYYVQRDYRHALVEFGRVVEMAPRAPKAGDALLRMGMCHATLREPSAAAELWQRVVREYPRSEAAGKAISFLRARAAAR